MLDLARNSDPATSHAAAESAKAFKARDIAKIYSALLDSPWQTYKEVAAATGLDPIAVARRLAEMERKNLIGYHVTGMRQMMRKKVYVWEPIYRTKDGCRVMRALP